MKTLSTLFIVIILLFSGCLGIFEEDFDDDDDGFLDTIDAFPNDSNEWLDTDGDGIGNNADKDDDDDGFEDALESSCFSDPLNISSIPLDMDQDDICDVLDNDIDGDG